MDIETDRNICICTCKLSVGQWSDSQWDSVTQFSNQSETQAEYNSGWQIQTDLSVCLSVFLSICHSLPGTGQTDSRSDMSWSINQSGRKTDCHSLVDWHVHVTATMLYFTLNTQDRFVKEITKLSSITVYNVMPSYSTTFNLLPTVSEINDIILAKTELTSSYLLCSFCFLQL